jgi:hypothetical protein
MRRRKLLVALAGLAVVLLVAVCVLPPRDTQVIYENLCRVRKGMTGAEVEAFVGTPGDFTTRPMGYDGLPVSFDVTNRPARTDQEWIWATDSGLAWVDFNGDGLVSEIGYLYGSRKEQGFFDNLLWRLKRQWRRWFP